METYLQIIFQLFLAVILGGVVGLEREYKKKKAGLQTYSLVTLGSCLFTLIAFDSLAIFPRMSGVVYNPLRVVQAVAIGIGFIGAGVIFHRQFSIEGLTTAAGLWVAAAIGIAVGAGLYFLAIAATMLAFTILAGLGVIEEKILGEKSDENLKQ